MLIGMFAAVFAPARSALLPTLIRQTQLVRANGLIAGLGIVATMIAYKVGGWLAENHPAELAFRLNAGTFVLSGVVLLMMRPPRQPRVHHANESTAKELLAGVRYVLAHRRVMELIGVAGLVWFCGPLVVSVIPALVRDAYGGSLSDIGDFRAMLGLGFIIGAGLITLFGEALRGEIAITWSMFGIGLSIALMGLSAFLPMEPSSLGVIGAIGIVGAGLFGLGAMASFEALMQRIVPNRYRGRVFGVKELACNFAAMVATGLLGVPDWDGLDQVVGYILCGVAVATFVAGGVTLYIRLGRATLERSMAFAENLNEFLTKFWYRLRRLGPSTIPRTGGVIITANHVCPADPLFIAASAPYRKVGFMVAAEYADWPVARFFIRLVECIPVRRDGSDMGATKQAIRHVQAGKALGIFIEGGIVEPGSVGRPKDGVALIALKTGAPVIPVHISGVQYHDSVVRGLLARHHARVRFGKPVDLSEFAEGGREAIRAASEKIYAAIQALAPPPGEPHQEEGQS
jgi:1-acyl-sn-glycerol-3-phosphate acyltransferase